MPPDGVRQAPARRRFHGRRVIDPSATKPRGLRGTIRLLVALPVCLGTTLGVATSGGQPAGPASDVRTLLERELHFSDSNLADLARGRVVGETLDTGNPDDVVSVGAVRIGVPRAFLVQQIRDIVSFKQSRYVLEIGTFGIPPRVADLAGLTLSPDDVKAIRTCRPGHCDVKLTAGMLERLQQEVDWSAPDAAEQASEVFKHLLVERLVGYLSSGTAALGTYVDKAGRAPTGEALAGVLAASGVLAVYAPELVKFLEDFPGRRLPDSESFLYWSKEVYGLKPVTSVTHVTIYTKTVGSAPVSFIVSRGVYADHYYEATMALTLAAEIPGSEPPAIDFVYVNRSRVDALGGPLGGLKRWIATRRVRNGMTDTLGGLKRRLERRYSAGNAEP